MKNRMPKGNSGPMGHPSLQGMANAQATQQAAAQQQFLAETQGKDMRHCPDCGCQQFTFGFMGNVWADSIVTDQCRIFSPMQPNPNIGTCLQCGKTHVMAEMVISPESRAGYWEKKAKEEAEKAEDSLGSEKNTQNTDRRVPDRQSPDDPATDSSETDITE